MLRLSGISPCCYGCRLFHHVVTAVANFTVELHLSEISPWTVVLQLWGISLYFYGCCEFRRVATALCGIFAVVLRLSGILPVATAVKNFILLLQLSGIPPCCCDWLEIRRVATAVGHCTVLLQVARISPRCYSWREFHRVATAIWNLDMCWYGCRRFRRVAAVRGYFAVLLRLSGISRS